MSDEPTTLERELNFMFQKKIADEIMRYIETAGAAGVTEPMVMSHIVVCLLDNALAVMLRQGMDPKRIIDIFSARAKVVIQEYVKENPQQFPKGTRQ